jgi:AraC-like DNA-binding protein
MLFNYIPIFTSGCLFLLSFIIAVNFRKVNLIANRWLAIFLICVAIVLLLEPLLINTELAKNPIFLSIINTSFFSLAPAMYFSVTYFVSPARRFQKKDLLHFALVVLIMVLNVANWIFVDSATLEKAANTPQTFWELALGFVLSALPIPIYWIVSYRKLIAHKKNVMLYSSSIETVDLTWLRHFLLGFATMIIFTMSYSIFDTSIIRNFSYLCDLCIAFYLAFFATQQTAVFSTKPETELELKTILEYVNQPETQRKQLLSDDELSKLKPELEELMLAKKPYLDSELGLANLAEMMELSTHQLSYLINKGFDTNFYNFVNSYRVQESQILLTSSKHDHLSMLGIAFEAGFNSKTAFNTTFKKSTGMSPTEYKLLNKS